MQNLSSISCHKNEWKNDDKLRSFLFSVAKTIRDIDLKFGVHPMNYFSILWEFFQEILRGSGGKISRNLMNWDGLTHITNIHVSEHSCKNELRIKSWHYDNNKIKWESKGTEVGLTRWINKIWLWLTSIPEIW